MFDSFALGGLAGPAVTATPARIQQMLEATRHVLERLTQLREKWNRGPVEVRTLDLQSEIIAEMSAARAYHRQLLSAIQQARNGLDCVAHWEQEAAEIARILEESAAWLRSIGAPWPCT